MLKSDGLLMKFGLKAKTSASKFPAVDGGRYIWLYGTISAGRIVSFMLTTFIRSGLESGSFEEDSGEMSPKLGFEVITGRLVKSSIFRSLLSRPDSSLLFSYENFPLFNCGGSWLLVDDSLTCFWRSGDKVFPYLLESSLGSVGWFVTCWILGAVLCKFLKLEAFWRFGKRFCWSSVCGRLPSRLLFAGTSGFGMLLMVLDFSCIVWRTLRWEIGGFGTCRWENYVKIWSNFFKSIQLTSVLRLFMIASIFALVFGGLSSKTAMNSEWIWSRTSCVMVSLMCSYQFWPPIDSGNWKSKKPLANPLDDSAISITSYLTHLQVMSMQDAATISDG